MSREILPPRRQLDAFEFDLNGVHYHATVGRSEDGQIAEVFLDAGKPGTGVNIMAKDAAVVFSIARQFGAPLKAIIAALSQEANGTHIGPLGTALYLADLNPDERTRAILTLVPPSD